MPLIQVPAVIAPDGQIRAHTALYESTFLLEDLAWPDVVSFYSRYGDVFVYACALAAIVMLGYGYFNSIHDGGSHVSRKQRETC